MKDIFQFARPDSETPEIVTYVYKHSRDLADAFDAFNDIEGKTAKIAKLQKAPLTVAEAAEKLKREAALANEEIDGLFATALYTLRTGRNIPWIRIQDRCHVILLALMADKIDEIAGTMVEIDGAMPVNDRNAAIADIQKEINKSKKKIEKLPAEILPPGQEFARSKIFDYISAWRNKQSVCDTAIDPYGTEITGENPWTLPYENLKIALSMAYPGGGTRLAIPWLKVYHLYQGF